MFKSKKESGFTLIELMIVIAIIGMLAAIVAVAVGKARNAAKDAKIKSDIAQSAIEAELIRADTDSYADLCNSTNDGLSNSATYSLDVLSTDLTKQGAHVNCRADASHYCISAQLNNGNYFCRDSSGRAADNLPNEPCGTSASSTCPTS